MSPTAEFPAVAGVCETEIVSAPGAPPGTPPELLVEVPHGATRRSDFEAVRRRLRSALPDRLEQFFFVNTDAGAPECASAVARLYVAPEGEPQSGDVVGAAPPWSGRPRRALVLRGLVPRTFIDCNRILGAPGAPASGLTPAIPEYVRDPHDLRLLERLYRQYQEAASRAYERVCGEGGAALILHTYAPRSVGIEQIDETIVDRLREAYRPENYARWPQRPEVDVISEDPDGRLLAPPRVVEAIRQRFARAGVTVAANATYRLQPETTGHAHSVRYPGRIVCLELRRDLLADPFTPFAEMRIGAAKVRRMAAPLAAALLLGAGAEPPV